MYLQLEGVTAYLFITISCKAFDFRNKYFWLTCKNVASLKIQEGVNEATSIYFCYFWRKAYTHTGNFHQCIREKPTLMLVLSNIVIVSTLNAATR